MSDSGLPSSSIPGILQARILGWVAISFSRRSSQPRDQTRVSRIAGRRFTIWATGGSIKWSYLFAEMSRRASRRFDVSEGFGQQDWLAALCCSNTVTPSVSLYSSLKCLGNSGCSECLFFFFCNYQSCNFIWIYSIWLIFILPTGL